MSGGKIAPVVAAGDDAVRSDIKKALDVAFTALNAGDDAVRSDIKKALDVVFTALKATHTAFDEALAERDIQVEQLRREVARISERLALIAGNGNRGRGHTP